MYYFFFETGNDAFFSGITDAFCSIVLRNIVEKKALTPLNCTMFPDVYCGNQECANNKIALTSDQLDKFEISMTRANHALLETMKDSGDRMARYNIQRILQSNGFVITQAVEQISISVKKIWDRNEYLRLYIERTNKLKDKAEGFVYVRAKTNSDYDYFKAHTILPNVIACENFQKIY